MGAVVIDASVASSWCFPDEQTEYTKAIFEAAFASAIDTVAPQLWAYEVRNSVLMGVRRGRITKSDSKHTVTPERDPALRPATEDWRKLSSNPTGTPGT